MKNIQMIIAYKGTRYAGWQRQPNAPTVEEVLTGAIKAVTDETVTLYGSGRTDAGVHALGQSANFHTESRVPPERFAAALNTKLPGDIRVLSSCEAPEGFHSRYSAKGKVYTYQLDLNQRPFWGSTTSAALWLPAAASEGPSAPSGPLPLSRKGHCCA